MTGLHVVYRSYGGENTKGRPDFYTKRLAVISLLRAVADAGRPVELIFLNDGPIPAERLTLMERGGEILTLPSVGNKRSLLTALALPGKRRWPGRDVVWFAEDDYLYLPAAFTQLGGAADLVPKADYLALYALIGDRPPEGGRLPEWLMAPKSRWTIQPVLVAGHDWRPGLATTATFGARVEVIGTDRHAFALSLATASTWDYTASLAYQGFVPFPWNRLLSDPRPGKRSLQRRTRVAAALPGRVAVDLAAIILRRRRRLLLAADPALCTHMETAHLALGSDWSRVSTDTADWAAAHAIG
ncbi:MAG: hypothetical protein ABJA34_10400 [Pseudonocardiales bacterium]